VRRVPGRTHFGEQPERLGELAPHSSSVSRQAVQLGAFDVDVRAPALGAGLVDELRHFRELGLDRLTRLGALKRTQTANVCDRGLAFLHGLALPLRDGDGLRRYFGGSPCVTGAEERPRVRRESYHHEITGDALAAADPDCLLGGGDCKLPLPVQGARE
jgi:hypothetical protein